MKKLSYYLLFLLFFTAFNASFAEGEEDKDEKKDPMSSSTFSGLKLRNIGPALTSGRIADFAVNPENNSEYYVGVASGGVWKTTNRGVTWEPVFDDYGSYSIGCVTLDPQNPHTVWVGTGENNSQRSVAYGDGIYKSVDGGKSFKNMGLKESEHIAKIIVHPEDSDIVYAASQGPLWGPGGDRGLFKTTDGGETWNNILEISENTGVTDIALDPRDPDVIYAASYQRRRHVFTLINGGPESGLHKSTDGGETWTELKSGLPGNDKGRIGIAVSPVNPDYIYAIIEAAEDKGGFFRSTDRGATWQKRGDYIARSPQYYMEIYCDPQDVNKVYSMDTYSKVTVDGGENWKNLSLKHRHVDDHALWIDPADTRHFIIGGDGGVYETWDDGENWHYKANLPIIQYYKVAVSNDKPFYYVYGGTQDNNSMGGPSRTISANGIRNSDWFITNGGDGFEAAVDPVDPNIVYSQSQYGWLTRYDRKTGEGIGIKPMEKKGEEPYRWNWDSPLIVSPHKHTRLYFAANVLFRSEDRGDSWEAVSGDLTRQIDRNKLPVMDKVWSVDAVSKNASTSFYGNIVALDESPLKEGLLYVGTDDGLVQVSPDGGKTWNKTEKVGEVPEFTYVNSLVASKHKEGRVYAAFNNHKNADFKPYVYRSDDNGKTWTNVTGNLPERGSVYDIAEDGVNENLLFAGTEFGVFFTVDGGTNWVQLKGGMPTISVRDLEIQERENDLVLASFGRGFFVLDDYTPLREVTKETLEENARIFPVKTALMYVQESPLGGRGKGSQGEALYAAENPPLGAIFTYYLKEAPKTLKKQRKEAEKEVTEAEKTIEFPAYDALRAEDDEDKPYLQFTVKDKNGNVVRKIKSGASKGINRVVWDLRYPAAYPAGDKYDKFDDGRSGFFVLPGKYSVTMQQVLNGETTELAGPVEFDVQVLGEPSIPVTSRQAVAEFHKELMDAARALYAANNSLEEEEKRIKHIRAAIQQVEAPDAGLVKEAKDIHQALLDLKRKLDGDWSLSKRDINQAPSISDRIGTVNWDLIGSTSEPTNTHRESLAIAKEELREAIEELRSLQDGRIRPLQQKLDNLGAPWTPGSLPTLN